MSSASSAHQSSAPSGAEWWLVAVVIAVGLALRLARLDDLTMWIDESYMYWGINAIDFNFHPDVNPPLYFTLLKGWSLLFGGSLTALRAFSLTLGVGSLAVAWGLLRALAPTQLTFRLCCLLALAVNPYLIDYSVEARNYALYWLLFLFSLWAYWRGLDRPNPLQRSWFWLLAGLGLAANYFNHYIAIFIPVGLGLHLLWWGTTHRQQLTQWHQQLHTPHSLRRTLLHRLTALFGPFVLAFLAWLPTLIDYHIRLDQNASWTPLGRFSLLGEWIYPYWFGIYPHFGENGYALPWLAKSTWGWIILGLLLIGLYLLRKHHQKTFPPPTHPVTSLLVAVSLGAALFAVVFSQLTGYQFFLHRYMLPYGGSTLLLGWWLVSQLSHHKTLMAFTATYAITVTLVVARPVDDPVNAPYRFEQMVNRALDHPSQRVVVNDYVEFIQIRANLWRLGDQRPVVLFVTTPEAETEIENYRLSLEPHQVISPDEINPQSDLILRVQGPRPEVNRGYDWSHIREQYAREERHGSFWVYRQAYMQEAATVR